MTTLRRSNLLRILSLSSLTLIAIFGTITPSAAQESGEAKLSFAKIIHRAVFRNVPDANGRELDTLAEGTVVRIHGERAGWVKAESPTGFSVWVMRKFVTETSDQNVVEITRNGINVRAFPSTGVNNFPVGQLYAGDRVRVIETPAEFADTADEWIHIWSPTGFWSWVRTGNLSPMTSGGLLAWEKAQSVVTPSAKAKTAMSDASETKAAETAGDAGVRKALQRADAALDRERALEKPNFELVRTAYAAVLKLNPTVDVKQRVDNQLATVGLLEATASMREELERERARRTREIEDLQRDIAEDTKRKDPLGGHFDERGLLERRSIADVTRYYLRWGGKDVCEVVCTSGRYDLSIFLSLDVGVRGELLPLVATDGGKTAPPIVDLSRIEILGQG
ncbi:MAG: hypothetical protein ACI87A_002593 [Planctomycetota bacterium]|jgi:hypothetical protein